MHDLITLMLNTRLAAGLQILSIQLNGVLVLLVFIIIGASIGWSRGIRAIMTVALVSVVAYLICVESGQLLIGTINRLYQNGPRLAAFALGRDPSTAPLLEPLIEPNFTIPLFFRCVLFLMLVAFGWLFRQKPPWYSAQPVGLEPLSRPLGAFVGGYIALIWTAACISFWVELVNNGQAFGGFIADILFVLPDITPFMPALITIFFLFLLVLMIFILPRAVLIPVVVKK